MPKKKYLQGINILKKIIGCNPNFHGVIKGIYKLFPDLSIAEAITSNALMPSW